MYVLQKRKMDSDWEQKQVVDQNEVLSCSVKGGLISESFSFWIKSANKRCQITTLIIFSLGAQGSDFGTFFGDLSQTEKLSEI